MERKASTLVGFADEGLFTQREFSSTAYSVYADNSSARKSIKLYDDKSAI